MGLRHRCSESVTQRACPVASISLARVPPVRATTKGRPSSFFVGTVAAVFLSPPDSPAAYTAQPLPTTAAAAATIAVKPHEVLRWLDVSTSVDSGADDSEVDVAAATVVEVTGFHDRAATEAAARTLRNMVQKFEDGSESWIQIWRQPVKRFAMTNPSTPRLLLLLLGVACVVGCATADGGGGGGGGYTVSVRRLSSNPVLSRKNSVFDYTCTIGGSTVCTTTYR